MRLIGLAVVLAVSLTPAPLAAEAQQLPRVARVGWMSLATPTAPALYCDVFRQGLRDLGYVEGQNLILEPRYTGGKNDLLPELIADLERVGPLICSTAFPSHWAAPWSMSSAGG